MRNVTDNDIDKLFREAADRNVPEFDPQDWEDMSRRLEHEERDATLRSKSLYVLVILLLIHTVLPELGERKNIQSASIFETPQSTAVAGKIRSGKELSYNKEAIATPATDDKLKDNYEDIESEKEDLNTSIRIINSLMRKTEKTNRKIDRRSSSKPAVENVNPDKNINNTNDAIMELDNGTDTGISFVDPGGLSDRDAGKLPAAVDDALMRTANETIASGSEGVTNEVDGIKNRILYDRPPQDLSELMAHVTNADKIVKPVEQEGGSEEQPTIIVRSDRSTSSQRWFIKVPVSPDFSAIDYAKLGKPGINIGLLGEYKITGHLSVSTGAIWSKKLYDSKNPDKSYSSGNWTGKASMLDGDCRVLDIPVNVTYYIFPDRRTNLFVSIGSSSYIMLKEKYVYTVWANQKEYQYEENFSHENNEWFSMLNLSIGIQQRLGKRFFAQAEPFLKAPVSGVGEGKVNLMSTGIFFSLKYSLNK